MLVTHTNTHCNAIFDELIVFNTGLNWKLLCIWKRCIDIELIGV